MWGDIAIAFLLAFITAFIATPYSIKLAKNIGAVDIPKDDRRMHKKPMPKLGRNSSNCRLSGVSNLFTDYNAD